ncbi:MAG: hypothetical protein AB7I18_11745 [Candidatus Berkiella sp.]
MKVKYENKSLIHMGLLSATLLFSSLATALPTQITFTNNTSLSLGTSIAGLPGNGVEPNATKSASYSLVSMGCFFGNVLNNCPIEFTDRHSGAKVATVYINAETATLTRAPQFHGTYGDEYEVTGWQASPISHIYIVKKATNTEQA